MPPSIGRVLSQEEIESLEREFVNDVEAGREPPALKRLEPLRKAQRHQELAAMALLRIIDCQHLSIEAAVEVLSEIAHAHPEEVAILQKVAECLESARDIDDLNAPPPADEVFPSVIEKLAEFAKQRKSGPGEEDILSGLGTAARLMARQHDALAERCYRRLTEIDPQSCRHHYNLGLFFKTRGRFAEGMAANQTAAGLADEPVDSIQWNLGICATGAGEGAIALEVWQGMGQKIAMGRFGLPEGGYPECKVRLAERPLAERDAAADDPGLEETIWIERLSPCHGIVRSVLYRNLGVDYGDVVLFDGAPITSHTYGDTIVDVFPHLATLVRRHYQLFDFAGTQEEARQLADVSRDLADDAVVYAHTENVEFLCANCWRDPDRDHEHREVIEKHVVTGRIAAPNHMDPQHLLDQLDQALAKRPQCQLYVPDLCVAAELDKRAGVESRRFTLLTNN
ncbi:MAG: hypothetical protein QNJ67_06260 [Kiloniellales bacterium]|nr:hypothetical protein [Kiloniellales bacterium]